MASDKDLFLAQIAQRVLAYDYIIEADREAMLSLVATLAAARGITTLEEQPLRTWFFEKRREFLTKSLVEIENANPEIAAFIQAALDSTKLADES